jgi:hypothetical protein
LCKIPRSLAVAVWRSIHADRVNSKALRGEARGRDVGLAEGRGEGLAWGEIKATQENILSLLTARFSAALATQAQPVVTAIQSIDVLKMLFQQLLRLPDEQTVRIALNLPNE